MLENDAMKVVVNEDGSYSLLDKKTGRTYENLGCYEDTGDMGNEYIYIQDTGKQVISTKAERRRFPAWSEMRSVQWLKSATK